MSAPQAHHNPVEMRLVLEALPAAERQLVEHLLGCPPCRAAARGSRKEGVGEADTAGPWSLRQRQDGQWEVVTEGRAPAATLASYEIGLLVAAAALKRAGVILFIWEQAGR